MGKAMLIVLTLLAARQAAAQTRLPPPAQALDFTVAELQTMIKAYPGGDRKSTRLNSSHIQKSRMPSSA